LSWRHLPLMIRCENVDNGRRPASGPLSHREDAAQVSVLCPMNILATYMTKIGS
jgi:hypothetical protein